MSMLGGSFDALKINPILIIDKGGLPHYAFKFYNTFPVDFPRDSNYYKMMNGEKSTCCEINMKFGFEYEKYISLKDIVNE